MQHLLSVDRGLRFSGVMSHHAIISWNLESWKFLIIKQSVAVLVRCFELGDLSVFDLVRPLCCFFNIFVTLLKTDLFDFQSGFVWLRKRLLVDE